MLQTSSSTRDTLRESKGKDRFLGLTGEYSNKRRGKASDGFSRWNDVYDGMRDVRLNPSVCTPNDLLFTSALAADAGGKCQFAVSTTIWFVIPVKNQSENETA